MMPETETQEATMRVASTITAERTRGASTPIEMASSSPMVSAFKRQRRARSPMLPTMMGPAMRSTSRWLAEVSEPMSQNVMAWSWEVGSATSLMKLTPALNSELTMTPASTVTRMRLPRENLLTRSTTATESMENANAVTEMAREEAP